MKETVFIFQELFVAITFERYQLFKSCNIAKSFIAISIDVVYYNYMEKKNVTFRIDPAIIKKLQFLAIEQDRSLTDLFLKDIQ